MIPAYQPPDYDRAEAEPLGGQAEGPPDLG